MFRSVTVKKILNGYVLTYNQWLEHLPPREVFMTAVQAKAHAGLLNDVMSYEDALERSQLKEPPQAAPAIKPVVEEQDERL